MAACPSAFFAGAKDATRPADGRRPGTPYPLPPAISWLIGSENNWLKIGAKTHAPRETGCSQLRESSGTVEGFRCPQIWKTNLLELKCVLLRGHLGEDKCWANQPIMGGGLSPQMFLADK